MPTSVAHVPFPQQTEMLQARREAQPNQNDVPMCRPLSQLPISSFPLRTTVVKGSSTNRAGRLPLTPGLGPLPDPAVRPAASGGAELGPGRERGPARPAALPPEGSRRRMPASCCLRSTERTRGQGPPVPRQTRGPASREGQRKGAKRSSCRRAPRPLPRPLPAAGRAHNAWAGTGAPPEGGSGAGRRRQAAPGELAAAVAGWGLGRAPP